MVQIRDETAADADAIEAVTIAAFKTLPISRQTEHFIIRALRATGALSISLVAEQDGAVVGHIAFSPITFPDGTPDWYGLGPVAVEPSLHGSGIGSALVKEGLARLQALGGKGCVLVGDPGYYGRFGFHAVDGLSHAGVPDEFVMALSFGDDIPRGQVEFHPAFTATE